MIASKSIISNFFTSIIIFPITILTGIIIARSLGPTGKGIYSFIVILINSFIPILFFGFGNGVQYFIGSKKYSFYENIFTIFIFSMVSSLFVSIVFFFLWFYNLLGESGRYLNSTQILIIECIIPLNSFFTISSWALKGDFKFKLVNKLNIIRSIIIVFLTFYLVSIMELGINGALLAYMIQSIIMFLILIVIIIRNYNPILRFNQVFLSKSFKFGIKSWIGTLFQQSNDKLDQILLGYFATPKLLGIYSIAYSFAQLLNFIPNAIASVLFNLTSSSVNKESDLDLITRIHRILLFLSIIISIFLIIISPIAIQVFYGKEFIYATEPLLILIPGMLGFSITRRIVSIYLSGKEKPGTVSLIQAIGALIGIALYLIFIPKYEIIGAAWATTIAFIISTSVAFYYFKKEINNYKIKFFIINKKDCYWIKERLFLFKGWKSDKYERE